MRPPRPFLALVLVFACQAVEEQPPPPPPPFEAELHVFAGTLLAGRLPRAELDVSRDPADAVGLTIEAIALEDAWLAELRLEELPLVGEHTRLIFSTPSHSLLIPAGLLTDEARVVTGDRARGVLATLRAGLRDSGFAVRFDSALPRGVTCYLMVKLMGAATNGGLDALILHASRADREVSEPLELALQVNGAARVWHRTAVAELEAGTGFGSDMEYRYEAAVLDASVDTASAPVVVVVPTTVRAGAPTAAIALALETHAPPARDSSAWGPHAERAAECVDEVARQVAASAAGSTALIESQRRTEALRSAAVSLFQGGTTRATLAYLGQVAGSALVGDLALLADDELLAAVVERVRAEEVQAVDGLDPLASAALGWVLERSAVLELTARLRTSELDDETSALLSLHVGELGVYPGQLERAVLASDDNDGFRAQVVRSNLDFLEDLDPAARITACDWLRAQGEVVPGYDPLGPYAERQLAVAAFREERAP